MTNDWLLPLITGASGVAGALIGTGGTIYVSRRGEDKQREDERLAALIDFWAAVHQVGMLWSGLGEAGIGRKGYVEEVRAGLRIAGLKKQLVDRIFIVTDRFWEASARARAGASPKELEIISGVDQAVADWEMGKPIPESWGQAVRRLLELIEGSSPVTRADEEFKLSK